MSDDIKKTLKLSSTKRFLAGVCGGIADFFNMDVSIVRVIFVLSVFILAGFPLLLYIILWIVLPVSQNTDSGKESDNNPDPNNGLKKKVAMIFSISFALILIFAGISLIVPNSITMIKDAGVIILSCAFLLLAVKMSAVMVQDKKSSPISLAFIIMLGTLSIFLPLISFDVLKFGVLFEYLKLIFPALLILVGIIIILNTSKKRGLQIIGLTLTSLIFIAIGVVSIKKGDYALSEKFSHFDTKWMKWMNSSQGPGSYDFHMKDNKSYKKYDYQIENRSGIMMINVLSSDLQVKGKGELPELITNLNDGVMDITLISHSGASTITLPEFKTGDIQIILDSGALKADLSSLAMQNMRLNIKDGIADVSLGQNSNNADISLNSGLLKLYLPGNKNIRISINRQHSHIDLPGGFIFSDNTYIYKVDDGPYFDLNVQIDSGKLKIRLDEDDEEF